MMSRITLEKFRALSRQKKLNHANAYWGQQRKFEAAKFDFSYTTFMGDCQKLGFKQVVIDPLAEDEMYTIKLDLNSRDDVVQKRCTVSKETASQMKHFLEGMTSGDKSKAVDYILNREFSRLNRLKKLKKVKLVSWIQKVTERIL